MADVWEDHELKARALHTLERIADALEAISEMMPEYTDQHGAMKVWVEGFLKSEQPLKLNAMEEGA